MSVVTALRATRRGGVALHVDGSTSASSARRSWRAGTCSRVASSTRPIWPRSARPRPPSASWATPTGCSVTAPGARASSVAGCWTRSTTRPPSRTPCSGSPPMASSTTPPSRAATSPTSVASAAGAASASVAACARSRSRRPIVDDVLAGGPEGEDDEFDRALARPAPQGRAGQARERPSAARVSDPASSRVLLIGRLRGRACGGPTGRLAAGELTGAPPESGASRPALATRPTAERRPAPGVTGRRPSPAERPRGTALSIASSRNLIFLLSSAMRSRWRTSISAICAPTPAALPTKAIRLLAMRGSRPTASALSRLR